MQRAAVRLPSLTAACLGTLLGVVPSPLPGQGPPGAPVWVHVAPVAGGVVVSRPGDEPRAAAALQVELSRALPIGVGVAAGWAFDGPGGLEEPVGPWLEGLFVYRFRLRVRGYVSPYAGPLVGWFFHETGSPGDRFHSRFFFGGRGGIDIPIGGGWPAARIEVAYRRLNEALGYGAADTATVLLGLRWSRAWLR